jgi:hypothetical protein
MSCTNNLKNLALAQHNHHDTYNMFSPLNRDLRWLAVAGTESRWARLGPLTTTLPFIEQMAIYEQIGPFMKAGGTPWNNTASITGADGVTYPNPFRTLIATFRCPSDAYNLSANDLTGAMFTWRNRTMNGVACSPTVSKGRGRSPQ